jgi:hypothetical protein
VVIIRTADCALRQFIHCVMRCRAAAMCELG